MTVIDGLARAGDERHAVLVARATSADRYDSADVIEYAAGPYLDRHGRTKDALLSRAGAGKPGIIASYGDVAHAIPDGDHVLLAHNAPFCGGRFLPGMELLYAHNLIVPHHNWIAARRAVAGYSGIIAVSDWLANATQHALGPRSRTPIHVVRNGVDTSTFTVPDRPEHDRVRVLFFGRVVPAKGPDLLLSALSRLGRDDIETHIVGSSGFSPNGPLTRYERALRQIVPAVPGPVTFQPFVDRRAIVPVLQEADIIVLPSRWLEPLGLVVLEAMAVGATVIVAETGGMLEAGGDAVLSFKRGSRRALADVLDAVVGDRALRQRLGAAARARAERFDWALQAKALDRVLGTVQATPAPA